MKLNIKHTIFILIIIFVSKFSFAQTPPISSNELDVQYTPKGTGPLNPASKNNSSYSGSGNDDYPKNIVKFTPTMIARSLIAFEYERNFHENFSLTAGLGFNFNKDRIFSAVGSDMLLFNNTSRSTANRTQVSMAEVIQNSEHSGVSPYFSVAPKFIYESYFFDGTGFVELSFMHFANKMDYTLPSYDASGSSIFVGSPSLKYSYNIFALKYGYQIVTEGKLATTHEFFFTLGYRTIKYNPVFTTDLTNGGNNYNTAYRTQYQIDQSTKSIATFMFGFGYSFGIGFK